MNIETLTAFLGWCTLVNFILLVLATVILVLFKDFAAGIHSKLLGLDKEELHREYFRYLANFKVMVVVFNLVPWFVLKFLM